MLQTTAISAFSLLIVAACATTKISHAHVEGGIMIPTDDRTHMIFLPETRGELRDKAAGPFLYSPDRYPYEDYLPDHLQQTHDSEFMLLHAGVDQVYSAPRYAMVRDRMHDILSRSHDEFLNGDGIHARELIDRFRDLVSETR